MIAYTRSAQSFGTLTMFNNIGIFSVFYPVCMKVHFFYVSLSQNINKTTHDYETERETDAATHHPIS